MIAFRIIAVVLSGLELVNIRIPGAWFAIDSVLLARALRRNSGARAKPHPYYRR